LAQFDVQRDRSVAAGLASDRAPVQEMGVRPGLGAARGVLVALVVGSAFWLTIAIAVLAMSGRL
jgi:hypothetical protein